MATKRQNQYVEAMRLFFQKNDMLPPVQKLAEEMGVCKNAAWEMMAKLEACGFIEKNEVGKYKRSGKFPR